MINQCLKAAWKQAAFSCRGLRSSEGVLLSGGKFVVDVEGNDIFVEGTGLEIFNIEKVVGLGGLGNGEGLIQAFGKADGGGGGTFGRERNQDLSVGDGGNKRGGENVAGFDTGFLRNTEVLDHGRNNSNGGKNDDQGNDDSIG